MVFWETDTMLQVEHFVLGFIALCVLNFLAYALANSRVLSQRTRRIYLWDYREQDSVFQWLLLFTAMYYADMLPPQMQAITLPTVALAFAFGLALMFLFPESPAR